MCVILGLSPQNLRFKCPLHLVWFLTMTKVLINRTELWPKIRSKKPNPIQIFTFSFSSIKMATPTKSAAKSGCNFQNKIRYMIIFILCNIVNLEIPMALNSLIKGASIRCVQCMYDCMLCSNPHAHVIRRHFGKLKVI